MASYFKKRNINFSLKTYFVDAFGAMAMGLFASLLIGTIFKTVYTYTGIKLFENMSAFGSAVSGPAIAVAVGMALNAPKLVLFSLCAVGYGAMTIGGAGGPFLTYIAAVVSCEAGKLVSNTSKLDIIVTPSVTIGIGTALIMWIGAPIATAVSKIGVFLMECTTYHPFIMGIIISVLVGIALTLPISSAAICASIGLTGIAGGAAAAGCCAHMIGFAFMSFRENGFGGLVAQGVGTSMLQMGNLTKKPILWIPPVIASAVTGPLSTCIFKLETVTGVNSGMGTCGLVGPIDILSSGLDAFGILGLVLICFVLPALISVSVCEIFRKLKWIEHGDLKLDL